MNFKMEYTDQKILALTLKTRAASQTVASLQQLNILLTNDRSVVPSFIAPRLWSLRLQCTVATQRCVSCCSLSSLSQPRIVILPGMDGTGLLLDDFRRTTSAPNDQSRVIPVDYPFHRTMTIAELGEYVCEEYLTPLENDHRGYILVNQSFSGHVGLHLSQQTTPGKLLGQVFVNAFPSSPAPTILRNAPSSITNALFRYQPPPWLVDRIFLGRNATNMEAVQAAASRVEPVVMSHRLNLCLDENSWHLWRRRDLLPSNSTMYLRGDNDIILRNKEARLIRLARRDIQWIHIPEGPHLLLQRYGKECGTAVNDFCQRVPNKVVGGS